MIDFNTLRQLVDKRLADAAFTPVLQAPRDQATYFMVAGHYAAKANNETNSFLSDALISFATTIPYPSPPAPDMTPVYEWDSPEYRELNHDRVNKAFRVSISRNKAKLESTGQLIADFKCLHDSFTTVQIPDRNDILLFIETYRYTFNPIVTGLVVDMLDITKGITTSRS